MWSQEILFLFGVMGLKWEARSRGFLGVQFRGPGEMAGGRARRAIAGSGARPGAGPGENFMDFEIVPEIPPGAAFGGAPGALRAPGKGHFRRISAES